MKTYEALAQAFLSEGVETCFALLGDANMHWANALSEKAHMIYMRHEHCAVAAASAFTRITGEVGVATVTCGPGLTQITTALPAAARAGLPLVIFAGEAPLSKAWYNQAIEQRPFVEACGAVYMALHHPAQMLNGIQSAFRTARDRRVPVVLGVPFDLQEQLWSGSEQMPPAEDPVSHVQIPNPNSVSETAELINAAERVVLLAGLGARNAASECVQLGDRIGALLATTLPARGLFCDHDFEIGIAGGFSPEPARDILCDADLVLAIGASLSRHTLDGGKLFPKAKIIQMDIAPSGFHQGARTAHHLMPSDAALGAKALLEKMTPKTGWRSQEMRTKLAAFKDPEIKESAAPHEPANAIAALDAVLPKDWLCVNSSGHSSYFSASMFGRSADNFLTIREFGAIGNGISYAIGAAIARPDARVVLFDGDGSLLMHVQELETIRRYNLNILICVLNDAAYGSEIHKLKADGLSLEGSVFQETDFARLAKGFGLAGRRIGALSQLSEDLESLSGPTVWDIPIDPDVASPQIKRVHAEKSK
ncbi:MAG: thiamine pyrophosphate-binding protein [Pseudomonadota bacterium]